MLQVTHQITIGSDRYSSPSNSRLIRLAHSARMDSPVNVCSLILSPPKGLNIAPDDDIKIELGNGQQQGLIFTGKVGTVDWRINEVRIEAVSSFRKLVHARYNMYFEQSPAGSIIRDICSEASVSTGRIEPGLTFDYYAIGSNSSACDQIRTLALQCGFDTYVDENDQLIFGLPIPGGLHLFQYGVNVLSLSLQKPGEAINSIDLFGESPASFGQGPTAATWVSKKEVKASATGIGSGVTRAVFDPSIRTIQQANLVARNYQSAWKPKQKGRIVVLGEAGIKMGHQVQIAQMPVSEQNGLFKVTGVEHLVSREQGFISQLTIEGM